MKTKVLTVTPTGDRKIWFQIDSGVKGVAAVICKNFTVIIGKAKDLNGSAIKTYIRFKKTFINVNLSKASRFFYNNFEPSTSLL